MITSAAPRLAAPPTPRPDAPAPRRGAAARATRRAQTPSEDPPGRGDPPADGSRRDVLGGALAFGVGRLSLARQSRAADPPARVEEPAQAPGAAYGAVVNAQLGYQFAYPLETISRKALPLVYSREPVHYSAAAPLSTDARQRIVCELVDLIDGVFISVSVGPPAGELVDYDPEEWSPEAVAHSVLADRSTARKPTGERISLSTLQTVSSEVHDGQMYCYYEHISRGSPTVRNASRETFRHSLAVTAWRPGAGGDPYLYTLNLTAPEGLWRDLAPLYQGSVESFRLTAVTKDYVPPDKIPLLPF
ncbi:unnamed protein product [Ostreobium quekettii]|uniref:Uncharacterized protein n=1 Tax=Ostreobium quekettii TaxID=121088 RepID=A0A8S1JIA5_9CHLO|nr:unnamed protein product [Ostreobium quekettii]